MYKPIQHRKCKYKLIFIKYIFLCITYWLAGDVTNINGGETKTEQFNPRLLIVICY